MFSRLIVMAWVAILLGVCEQAVAESEESEIVEPAGPMTLGQAVVLSLSHSPSLAVFPWDFRVAEARKLQAGLWPNPEMDA